VRADGQWEATVSLGYDAHGKRIRRAVFGRTKQEAQEALRKLQTDHALGRLTDAGKFTVADYLTLWLDQTARVKVAAATYDRYKLIVDRQLKPHLGALRLNKLTTFHVSQLDAILEKQGESPRQRQMAQVVFGTALRDAVRKKLLAFNPVADAARPRPPKKEMTVWDAGQVRRFLAAAEADRLYALYVVALDTGMRQGELLALQWPDVDFEAGAVTVQRSLSDVRGKLAIKPPKTAAGRRRIVLSRFAVDALHEHRKRMLAEGRDVKAGIVFCSTAGTYPRRYNLTHHSFRKAIRRASQKAAEEAAKLGADVRPDVLPVIRFHDLRHTAATLLLTVGVNVKVVSERLGHESVEITLKVYAHVLPTMQQAAAEKLDRIFAPDCAGKEGIGARAL
jgi:integrase